MIRSLKTEGIILGKKSLLNRDYLVTIFSKDMGKLKVFAKGIKKITSRRLSHIETGNLIHAMVSVKADRYYLQETTLISGFAKVKNNPKRIGHLYEYFYILERLLPENQKENSLYCLTVNFLVELSNNQDFSEINLTNYINMMMQKLGYSRDNLSSFELKRLIEEIISEQLPSYVI